MSEWNEFIQNEMLNSGNLVEGAITSSEDFGIWGTSSNFPVTEEEIENLIKINKDFQNFNDKDVIIGNEHYVGAKILTI